MNITKKKMKKLTSKSNITSAKHSTSSNFSKLIPIYIKFEQDKHMNDYQGILLVYIHLMAGAYSFRLCNDVQCNCFILLDSFT